jgi:hypothetical protein
MDQKQFEQKLSEVAEWRREPLSNENLHKGGYEYLAEVPTKIVIKKIKPTACPYVEGNTDCDISCKFYEHLGQRIFVRRCQNCRHVITPKGHVFYMPSVHNIAARVVFVDRDDK